MMVMVAVMVAVVEDVAVDEVEVVVVVMANFIFCHSLSPFYIIFIL